MPHINEFKQSKFLKKEDVGSGVQVTISGVSELNVAKEGAEPELKWCLTFHETEKPMVLNSTNAQIIAKSLGSEQTDDWHGKKIVLYNDPNVSFAGKVMGGIRVRAPQIQAAPKIGGANSPSVFGADVNPLPF